jgi:hypothetical protein
VSVQSQARLEGAPYFWNGTGLLTPCGGPGVGTAWRGIGCNQQGAVINISLPGLNLGPASLPARFAKLTQLQEINLQGNGLTGGYLSCKATLLLPVVVLSTFLWGDEGGSRGWGPVSLLCCKGPMVVWCLGTGLGESCMSADFLTSGCSAGHHLSNASTNVPTCRSPLC